MPVASLNVKRQISNIIRHFKFEELEASVLPLFPEISWSRIKTRLVKQHLNFSVRSVVKIIEEAIDEFRITEKVLKERLSILEVIDISRHHTRKTWHCYELKSSNNEMDFMTKRDLKNKVTQFFLLQSVQVEVQATCKDGIMFTAIKEKPRKRQVRIFPVFFALLLGQKHFFCSKRAVSSDCIQAITHAMGHNSSKKVKLSGKDLPSLIKFIWQKRQGAVDANTELTPYQDSKPVITKMGMDLTQDKHRREYMEKCFGDEPPTLESLVLDSVDQTWQEEEAIAKLPNKKIFLGWEFRSHNVANFIENLAERKILAFPIPLYLSQWMTTGRNQLTIQEN